MNVGQRVVSYRFVDREPDFTIPPGCYGTIVLLEEKYAEVRMDAAVAGAEPWNNVVQFCDDSQLGHGFKTAEDHLLSEFHAV